AVLAGLEIQDEEVGILSGSGPAVGAGRDVGHALGFVGGDAVDALVGNGNGIDLGLAGGGVVNHGVAARVVLAFLPLAGVALLGAEVDLAAGADVVARVDLGLAAEAAQVLADGLVGVHHHFHLLLGRVKLDEPGVHAVGVRADVEPAV